MLNENQKKALGFMTDVNYLTGSLRESVSSNDDLALEHIALYKDKRWETLNEQIINIGKQITSLESELQKLNDERAILNEV
jgi:hypothetical protein